MLSVDLHRAPDEQEPRYNTVSHRAASPPKLGFSLFNVFIKMEHFVAPVTSTLEAPTVRDGAMVICHPVTQSGKRLRGVSEQVRQEDV